MKTFVFALFACLFSTIAAAQVEGQTVFNPKTVQFNASAEHSSTLTDGTSIVSGYRVKHFLSGAASPLMTVDLCKPVPVNGIITVTTTSSPCPTGGLLFASPLVVNTIYVAKVTAYGPGGESLPSAASNPFALSGAPSAIAGAPIVRQ
jgi:hypothetical protein